MSCNSVLNQPIGIHERLSFWPNKESSFWTLIYILFIYWSVYIQLKIRFVSLCLYPWFNSWRCLVLLGFVSPFFMLFSKPEIAKYAPASNNISHSFVSDSLRPPWNVAHRVSLSMGFSRQGNWSGLPFPLPGDRPDRGIESGSPEFQAYSLSS